MVRILQILLSILKDVFKAPSVEIPKIENASPKPRDDEPLDWTNPSSKISQFFTVKDALMLREWGRLADDRDGLTDEIKSNILKTAKKLDTIRLFINKPIFVKSWLRPSEYNVFIGGAKKSAHMDGLAVDWWTDESGDGKLDGEDCDLLKEILMPKLGEWEVRMEDNGKGARWIHIDLKPVKNSRFFKP